MTVTFSMKNCMVYVVIFAAIVVVSEAPEIQIVAEITKKGTPATHQYKMMFTTTQLVQGDIEFKNTLIAAMKSSPQFPDFTENTQLTGYTVTRVTRTKAIQQVSVTFNA
ncbi:hypothetical protein DdX_18377 [Ditylenchus destructor]|uniref:Uncharacterized protein n=1 Tax=Ditylenchus destructor TaxID=166010 RepID=A0AAD4QY59_9BILA|nr:hypothetical protein DdX_18377 [Ditylenchus destructor]